MKTRVWLPLAMASSLLGAAPAVAQEAVKSYPSRPIRMIVPNTPGSAVDTLSRIVGAELGNTIGQQVVTDNRAGAGGIIGMEIAKDANPDGYTLISATTAASTIARLLQKKALFHPVNDYDYVCQYAETLNVLVVNPTLPIKSVKELIAYAKSGKTPFNMASAGAGSQSHLAGAYFQQRAGIESLHVPYKGSGAVYPDLMAQRVTLLFDVMGSAIGEVQSRRGVIEDITQEGDHAIIVAKAPVAEMFGFATAIRSATQGRAFWSTENVGFQSVPSDLQPDIVRKIRERKGLSPEPYDESYYAA